MRSLDDLNSRGSFVNESVARLLRNYIHERVGLYFDDQRLDVFIDRLQPLVTEPYLSFLDFFYMLKDSAADAPIWGQTMDALTVQETYFWREMDQIQALVDHVVPAYYQSNTNQPLRIWVAACATGEEALTIAMALDQAGWYQRIAIDLYASDASPGAIARAKQGIYRERAFRSLPEPLRSRYFTSTDARHWAVKPELQKRVQYRVANVMDDAARATSASVPIIFCRNVFIYFSQQAIARSVSLFAARMSAPGILFVGASESLVNLTEFFELQEIAGAFGYVKK